MASDGRWVDPSGFASDSSWGYPTLLGPDTPDSWSVLSMLPRCADLSEWKSYMVVDCNLVRSLGQGLHTSRVAAILGSLPHPLYSVDSLSFRGSAIFHEIS